MANQYTIDPIMYYNEAQLKVLSLLDRFYDLAQLEQKYTDQNQPVPARIQGESLRVYDELLSMIADISRATDKRKRHDGK